MRKSKEEAAETRARIIRKASKEFDQHGIAGAGLADVMKSAGLTHGGFYKHFQSKDELVAEALERSLEKSFQAMEHSADEGAIAEIINEYLSRVHRDDFDNACPLPALGTELWRAGGKTRAGTWRSYDRSGGPRGARWGTGCATCPGRGACTGGVIAAGAFR